MLIRILQTIIAVPRLWKSSWLFIQATNDMADNRFEDAWGKLEYVYSVLPNKPEHSLLASHCRLKMGDRVGANDYLKDVERKINGSRHSPAEKKYLSLYASYLMIFLSDNPDQDELIREIRNEAADIRIDVPKRYLRYLPIT